MFKREDYQLESGKLQSYAFPGGYPIFYVCADGGILCAGEDCANGKESRQAVADCRDDRHWLLVAADVNLDDDTLCCDHCGKRIESAYGEGS